MRSSAAAVDPNFAPDDDSLRSWIDDMALTPRLVVAGTPHGDWSEAVGPLLAALESAVGAPVPCFDGWSERGPRRRGSADAGAAPAATGDWASNFGGAPLLLLVQDPRSSVAAWWRDLPTSAPAVAIDLWSQAASCGLAHLPARRAPWLVVDIAEARRSPEAFARVLTERLGVALPALPDLQTSHPPGALAALLARGALADRRALGRTGEALYAACMPLSDDVPAARAAADAGELTRAAAELATLAVEARRAATLDVKLEALAEQESACRQRLESESQARQEAERRGQLQIAEAERAARSRIAEIERAAQAKAAEAERVAQLRADEAERGAQSRVEAAERQARAQGAEALQRLQALQTELASLRTAGDQARAQAREAAERLQAAQAQSRNALEQASQAAAAEQQALRARIAALQAEQAEARARDAGRDDEIEALRAAEVERTRRLQAVEQENGLLVEQMMLAQEAWERALRAGQEAQQALETERTRHAADTDAARRERERLDAQRLAAEGERVRLSEDLRLLESALRTGRRRVRRPLSIGSARVVAENPQPPYRQLAIDLAAVRHGGVAVADLPVRIVEHHGQPGLALFARRDGTAPLSRWTATGQEGSRAYMLLIPRDQPSLAAFDAVSATDWELVGQIVAWLDSPAAGLTPAWASVAGRLGREFRQLAPRLRHDRCTVDAADPGAPLRLSVEGVEHGTDDLSRLQIEWRHDAVRPVLRLSVPDAAFGEWPFGGDGRSFEIEAGGSARPALAERLATLDASALALLRALVAALPTWAAAAPAAAAAAQRLGADIDAALARGRRRTWRLGWRRAAAA